MEEILYNLFSIVSFGIRVGIISFAVYIVAKKLIAFAAKQKLINPKESKD